MICEFFDRVRWVAWQHYLECVHVGMVRQPLHHISHRCSLVVDIGISGHLHPVPNVSVSVDIFLELLAGFELEVAGHRIQQLVVLERACVDGLFQDRAHQMWVVSENVLRYQLDQTFAEALHDGLLQLILLVLLLASLRGVDNLRARLSALCLRVDFSCVYF